MRWALARNVGQRRFVGQCMREPKRCGRPTKTGAACRQIVHGTYPPVSVPACNLHMTDEDRATVEVLSQAWREGYEYCKASTVARERMDMEILRDKIRYLEQSIDKARRRYGGPGGQFVTIDNRLAYCWEGQPPLEVGEKVHLPGNWYHPDGFIGEVTALGITYDGPLVSIRRRA